MERNHQNKIQIKNFSQLDNWSWSMAIDPKKGLISSSQLDFKLCDKILEVLNSYGYDITIIGIGDYLEKNGLTFGSENNLIEHRAEVVKKPDYNDFKHDYLIDNDFENESDMTKVDKDKMQAEYDELDYDEIGNITYSFFVGKNISKQYLKQAAIYYGYLYMKMLHDMSDTFITKPTYEENFLRENEEGYKLFLNTNGIHISNKNVERVLDVNYRLYKDSKFFGEAKSEIKEYRRIIDELIALR